LVKSVEGVICHNNRNSSFAVKLFALAPLDNCASAAPSKEAGSFGPLEYRNCHRGIVPRRFFLTYNPYSRTERYNRILLQKSAMPQILVQDQTFERLQRNAKPFVDTPDTVINRALDVLEQLAVGAPAKEGHTFPERLIDPRVMPNLTHTKVLDALIDGEAITKANWNSLLDEMLRRAMKRVTSFEELRQLCPVNIVKGRKEDEGYGYLSDIDISVQGQDANGACRALVTAAQGVGVSLDITFMWRSKDSAAFPGERARLSVNEPKNVFRTKAA
jgi:hypothetical protein